MMIQNAKEIEGFQLVLRLVEPDDAAYVHALRNDVRYNTHLSLSVGSVEEQHAWIKRYKEREAEGTEYYYMIERREGREPCGVVRLYEIRDGRFTWGSWILGENKPFKAALESALLVYTAGFERLSCDLSVFDVRLDNERTISFHRRFGAAEVGRDEKNVYFEYTRTRFETDLPRHTALLARGSAARD
jgi:RimJ/RimL family protein N-acetyltransferase